MLGTISGHIKRHVESPRILRYPGHQDFLRDYKGKMVLDAGCGAGQDVRVMVEHGIDAIGIDKEIKHIAYGLMKNKDKATMKQRFRVGDVCELSSHYDPGSFDCVYSNGIIHWLEKEIPKFLSEVYKVLKPDGKFFGMTMSEKRGDIDSIVNLPEEKQREILRCLDNATLLSYETLERELEGVGFRDVSIKEGPLWTKDDIRYSLIFDCKK